MTNLNAPENQGKNKSATELNKGTYLPEEEKISQQEQSLTAEEEEQIRKRANARTEAEAQSIDGKAGQSGKSSHDHMSNVKAGTGERPGGGAKH